MRVLFVVLVWSALLYSCKEVSFREAQPIGIAPLKEIPANLRGIYQLRDETTGEFSDTLIVESWGYHFKDKNDKDWLGRGVLSDSLIVKFYQDYYFVNFKSDDQWVLRLVKRKPSGAIEFLSIDIQDEKKQKEILKKLGKNLGLKEIKKDENTFYQINPTPAQLMTLIKEGYFTGTELQKVKQ